MQRLSFILLILISCSWFSNLAEGVLCEEDSHPKSSVLTAADIDRHDAAHVCHAGSCHFGHCSHIDARSPSTLLKNPGFARDSDTTPYAFSLPAGILSFPLRPPVSV